MSELPEIYRRHLEAATGDVRLLDDVWEPDGVLEFPYAAAGGTAERVEGVAAMRDYFAALTGWSDWRFGDEVVRAVGGGHTDEYVVELHGSADKGDGTRYEQDYIVRFGLSPRGRIAWMREFWDPTRMG